MSKKEPKFKPTLKNAIGLIERVNDNQTNLKSLFDIRFNRVSDRFRNIDKNIFCSLKSNERNDVAISMLQKDAFNTFRFEKAQREINSKVMFDTAFNLFLTINVIAYLAFGWNGVIAWIAVNFGFALLRWIFNKLKNKLRKPSCQIMKFQL